MVALIVDTGVAGRTTYLGRKNVFATFSCRQHEQGQVSPVAAGGRGSHTLLCQQLDTAAGIGETEVCKPGPVLGTTYAQMRHGGPRSVTKRCRRKLLLHLHQLQR